MDAQSACPISGQLIDQTSARISALLVAGILLAAVFTPLHWLAATVFIDYAIKLLFGTKPSPLCFVARMIAKTLSLPAKLVDAAPKRFAAELGLTFVTLALASLALGLMSAFYAFAGMFAVCALLDGAFGFCIGCRIYQLMPHPVHE